MMISGICRVSVKISVCIGFIDCSNRDTLEGCHCVSLLEPSLIFDLVLLSCPIVSLKNLASVV